MRVITSGEIRHGVDRHLEFLLKCYLQDSLRYQVEFGRQIKMVFVRTLPNVYEQTVKYFNYIKPFIRVNS